MFVHDERNFLGARIQKEEKVEFLTEKIGFFFVEFQKSKITFDFKAYI